MVVESEKDAVRNAVLDKYRIDVEIEQVYFSNDSHLTVPCCTICKGRLEYEAREIAKTYCDRYA